ncbi:hypothetical protein GS462_11125 [Rhodococcus hoagii]|nr:hypothetical protein [Prescottella equi]MBM4650964.1 hypothetical protein [Prescottella equi]MBM4686689.1 hypothetical protein [Prescottella equi]
MSEQIPYDEMRRILGLPDVRDEVLLMRMTRHASLPIPTWWQLGQVNPAHKLRVARPVLARFAASAEQIHSFVAHMNEFARAAAAVTRHPLLAAPLQPKTSTHPRIPRPSHTPPPWAPDPARTRRTKNGGIDMRTPRV